MSKTLYDEYLQQQRSVTVAGVTDNTAVKRVTAGSVTHSLQKRCMMCGKEIEWRSKRQDAKTCSANCRKAMSRRGEAIKREVQAIQDALANLRRFSDRWPDLQDAIKDAVQQSVTAASVTLMDLPY